MLNIHPLLYPLPVRLFGKGGAVQGGPAGPELQQLLLQGGLNQKLVSLSHGQELGQLPDLTSDWLLIIV